MRLPKGFLSIKEAAKKLFISENRLRKWVRKNKIPFHRFNDHRILFDEQVLDELIPEIWKRLGRGDYIEWLLNDRKHPYYLIELEDADEKVKTDEEEEEEFRRLNPNFNPDDYPYEKIKR